MNRIPFAIACALALLLLAGCASRPQRPAVPVDEAAARAHDQQRGAIGGWRLSGRLAVSSGSQGGSGRIEWTQAGDRYEISLSAPVTRQSWRLSGDAAGARLEGVEGGPLESADAEGMLFAATGWRIPVQAMVAWVRAIPAAPPAGPASVAYAAGDVPGRLEQLGWRIDYRDWHPATATRPALPRRIEVVEAARGDARVRLLIDQWEVAPREDAVVLADALSPEAELSRTLAGFDLADPVADMRRHVAAGDRRPLVVCGFACLAPGLEGGAHGAGDARIIDGTGDVVSGGRHLALKHQAESYARAYNLALAAHRAGAAASADPH